MNTAFSSLVKNYGTPRSIPNPPIDKSKLVLTHILRFLSGAGHSVTDHDALSIHPDKVDKTLRKYLQKTT